MKNIITIVVVIAVVAGAAWLLKGKIGVRTDPKGAEFNDQCDKLIQGLQQYKEFFKRYPSGTTAEISKALSGQAEGGVVIMATKNSQKNDKGEIVDPWGTTIQFFFSHNAVLIRSAGPNKSFEDSRTATCDDLYRTETK
jgi:hypothetical protein